MRPMRRKMKLKLSRKKLKKILSYKKRKTSKMRRQQLLKLMLI